MDTLRSPLGFLLLFMVLACPATACPVYFKDGAVLDCESFWRSGHQIVVKVNRDVLLKFAEDEVNLRKTFAKRRGSRLHGQSRSGERASVSLPAASAVLANVEAPYGDAASARGTTPSAAHTVVPGNVDRPVQTRVSSVVVPREPVQTVRRPVVHDPMSPTTVTSPTPPISPMPLTAMSRIGATTMFAVSVLMLAVVLVMLVACWKVYEKAGQAGWKSLVPVYNMYILVLIAGKPWWWFLVLFVPVVQVAIYLLLMLALAERFGKGPLFGVGLFFVNFICFPVLAFDRSQYR